MFQYVAGASRPVMKYDSGRADGSVSPTVRTRTFYNDATGEYRQRTEMYCYFNAAATAGDITTIIGHQSTAIGTSIAKYQPLATRPTTAISSVLEGVILATQTATSWGWVAIQGYVDGVLCYTGISPGDFVECHGTAAYGLDLDGGVTGSTAFAESTIGVAVGAGTKSTRDAEILLYGRLVDVANS